MIKTTDNKKLSHKGYAGSCIMAMCIGLEILHDSTKRCTGDVKNHQKQKKGLTVFSCKSLLLLARPKRFERSTDGFVVRYSIQLSYGR